MRALILCLLLCSCASQEKAANLSDSALLGMTAATLAVSAKNDKFPQVASAYVTNFGLNYAVKKIVKRERPNGVDDQSFYSGHTSTAFVGAGALCAMERREVCYSGLAVASLIGFLRVYSGWHYTSDVAVGAAVGFLHGRFFPMLHMEF